MMPPEPAPAARVRVLMPVHDTHPAHLREAVQSVLDQDFAAWELVVADDGSSRPETLAALANLPHEVHDARIRILRQDNAGPGAARNLAAAGARTDYLLPLDSDDLVDPGFLREAVPVLDGDPGVVCVAGWSQHFGADGLRFVFSHLEAEDVCRENVMTVTSLYRRELFERVGGYSEDPDLVEDWDLNIRYLHAAGGRLHHLDRPALRYRIREGSRRKQHAGTEAAETRSMLRVMLSNGDIVKDRPELLERLLLERLEFRDRAAAWEARYDWLERLGNRLGLGRFRRPL